MSEKKLHNTHKDNQGANDKNSGTPGKKRLVPKSPDEKLLEDIYRPDMEKFLLFTSMLRRNKMFNKATITHKD